MALGVRVRQEQEASLSHYIVSQESEKEQQAGLGYKTSRSEAHVLIPSARFHFLKVLQCSKNSGPTGNKVFRCVSL